MTKSRDSIHDVWGARTPYVGEWPQRQDEQTSDTPERWVQSACVLCSNGCGVDIGVKDGRIVGVRGRVVDRVNHGRLGPKGMNGWIANASKDRLTTPLVRRDGKLVPASWDEAMGLVVEKSQELLAKYSGGTFGFYNSGQLFLEEYYTLSIIGDAGIGTLHMDGNTRLCTATAATALIESFGTDGQPGSFTDFDVTDAIFLVGHNMAETQTVQWARVLDRRRGPRPPRLIVVDPRATPSAKEADVHLAPRVGTNVALLNGLLNIVIEQGGVDRAFVRDHSVGFDELVRVTSAYPPRRVSELTGIPVEKLLEAGEILARSKSLVSTCLQGVYQSWQATAAAVQVNNLHIIRGLIGKPGCTVFQMNGQPSAQNTRECGANGELVAFRNWANPKHIEDLGRIWNVSTEKFPHFKPPTPAMEIFRLCEMGSIRFLWILATNPAVSMPELARIRRIFDKDGLFLVVNDAFLTETAQHADVVFPAAIWGEKTGCFTNADRTVHISHKAIDPPGQARSDLEILVEYARRMQFEDKDGAPLIKWSDARGAFDAWKACSKGQPCDYSGLTYEKLSQGSGIQWPCTDERPGGTERLYTDGIFNTDAERCETYGHDIMTGAAVEPEAYRAKNPAGRAIIKPADALPLPEQPDAHYPLLLTTGRLVHHFHTRTKTARTPLQDAAPDAFVQLSPDDAARLGIVDGDRVEVVSRRGRIEAAARVGDIEPGHVFVPFHFGAFDRAGVPQAANELTITGWDPVSKQPHFKFAAVRVRKV